jgi:hypothetical protein
MAIVQWVEGDTSQRVFVLYQNGAVVNLTGATVEAVLRPSPLGGRVLRVYAADVVSAVEGKVGWAPPVDALKIVESPYTARFRVTLGGVKSFFPFPLGDIWQVIE